jgi:hypothetical protein
METRGSRYSGYSRSASSKVRDAPPGPCARWEACQNSSDAKRQAKGRGRNPEPVQEQLTWVSKQIERESLIDLQALHVLTADFNAKFGTCWNLCYYLQNHWKYWTKWSRPWKNWIEEHIARNLVDDQTFDWSGLTVEFNTKFGTKYTAIGILTWH